MTFLVGTIFLNFACSYQAWFIERLRTNLEQPSHWSNDLLKAGWL